MYDNSSAMIFTEVSSWAKGLKEMAYMNKYLNWKFDLHFKLWEGENILILLDILYKLLFKLNLCSMTCICSFDCLVEGYRNIGVRLLVRTFFNSLENQKSKIVSLNALDLKFKISNIFHATNRLK